MVTAPHSLLASLGGPDAVLLNGFFAAQLIEVLVPVAVFVWLATVQRLWRTWPIMLAGMILTATLGAVFWTVLRAAANYLG